MAKAQFDREQVIEDAVTLFWRNGFSGSSMQQVVETTGLKPGSLYLAFGNKEGLFREALEHYSDKTIEYTRATLEQAPTIGEGICEILENIVKVSASSQYCSCFLIKTQLELATEQNELFRFSSKRLERVESLYRHYIGQEFGVDQSVALANSLMLHIFGAQVYGYQSGSEERLLMGLRQGLPWLPWVSRCH